jgi:hypothetical protein
MNRQLDALKTRHAQLESLLAAELRRPRPDDFAVMRLKIAKLKVKDEISKLVRRSASPSCDRRAS